MEPSGLSARETALLASWERERRTRLTLDELKRRFGGEAAKLLAKRMAAKGVLDRIGRGVYAIRPLRLLPSRASPSTPVLVAHLLAGTPYYLGGLWGLTHHHLTTQQYVSVLDVFVKNRRRPRTLGPARLVFHVLRPESFEYGITTATLEGVGVNVSDPERTVLDLLDYPELAGGLLPALGLVEESLPRVDPKRLVEYAIRGSRLSTCQRLGVLLERAGIPSRALSPLHRQLRASSSRLSMVPGRPRHGSLNARWNVVENDRPGDQR